MLLQMGCFMGLNVMSAARSVILFEVVVVCTMESLGHCLPAFNQVGEASEHMFLMIPSTYFCLYCMMSSYAITDGFPSNKAFLPA